MARSGIMLAYPFEEKRLEKWNDIVIVQPKLDGERCRTIVSMEPSLVSSENELKNFALPELVSATEELFLRLGETIELDGELYIHGESWPEIHSVVSRKVSMHPLQSKMELHVFDIVDLKTPQLKRLKKLMEISKLFPPNIKLVPFVPASSLEEVRKIFNSYINEGYEGIIVRNCDANYVRARTPYMMKFKPKKSDIYPIVGWVEGKGKYAQTIGALVCCGDDGTAFEVGSFSITDEERKKLWAMRDELTLFDCKVGYQHRLPSGIPKSAVFTELLLREVAPVEVNPFL